MDRLIWVQIGPAKRVAACLMTEQPENRLCPLPCCTSYNGLGDARRAKSFEDVGSVVRVGKRFTTGHFERLARSEGSGAGPISGAG